MHPVHRSPRSHGRRPAAMFVACLLMAACGTGSASPPPSTFTPFAPTVGGLSSEQADVDLGMRSDTDGPSFGNYQPDDNFGPDDAIALFGADAICESPTGDCVVKAKAQAWIDKVAGAAQGGVCEGMALWSLDRFLAGVRPPTASLPLDSEVNDRIVRLFATQFLPQVSDEARTNRGLSLQEFVTRLRERLAAGGGVTMGIYSDLGGHTLVPYAVDDVSDTRSIVAVYDPNWPGQERYLEVDLEADTWRYSFFAVDQSNDAEAWFGTGKQIDFVSLEQREAPFPEAFEGSGSGQVVLTITTASRNWAISAGDTVLADPTSSPGEGVVDALIRGAFGTTTVVARLPVNPAQPVTVATEQPATLTLESTVGSIRAETTTASTVTLTTEQTPTVSLDTGEGRVVATTDTGRVEAPLISGSAITVTEDEVTYRADDDIEAVAIDLSGDDRRDFSLSIPESGTTPVVEQQVVPVQPASVRAAAEEGLVSSKDAEEPQPESSSTTTTPSSTAAPSTEPSTTTSAPPATVAAPPTTPTPTAPVPATSPPTIALPTTPTPTAPRNTTTTVPRSTTSTSTTTTTVPPTTTTSPGIISPSDPVFTLPPADTSPPDTVYTPPPDTPPPDTSPPDTVYTPPPDTSPPSPGLGDIVSGIGGTMPPSP